MISTSTISIMGIVFTVTTLAVLAFPLLRLAPSWLESAVGKKIAFHSAAIDALIVAIERTGTDVAQRDRLAEQLDYNRAALAALAPTAAAKA